MRLYTLLLLIVIILESPQAQSKAMLTVYEIVKTSQSKMKGMNHVASFTMSMLTRDRTLGIKLWMKGGKKTLIKIESPAKEKDVGSLKIENEMWNYLPNAKKVIKIPSSLMAQSWMGSDFTNDDLIKMSSESEDYTHTLLGEEKVDRVLSYKIECIPKPQSKIIWKKLLYWVDKKNILPVRQQFFNDKNELIKELTFTEQEIKGGRLIPTRLEMKTLSNKSTTIIKYKQIEFDLSEEKLPDSYFTQQNLQRGL